MPGQTVTGSVAVGSECMPSMEGRAIARPNLLQQQLDRNDSLNLQWRAGQLPGQTPQRPGRKNLL